MNYSRIFFLLMAICFLNLTACTQIMKPCCVAERAGGKDYIEALGKMGVASVDLSDNNILFIGGIEREKTSHDILKYNGNEIESFSKLVIPRYQHTATLLNNGHILVIGGYRSYGGDPVSELEIIDVEKKTSHVVGRLTTARAGHATALLKDIDALLVIGGTGSDGLALRSAELIDYNKFSKVSEYLMKNSRSDFQLIYLPDGDVLCIGGVGSDNSSIERFSLQKGHFSVVGNLANGRFIHQSVLLKNGKVLTTGGFNGVQSMETAEIFDITNGISRLISPMATRRDAHRLIVVSDRVFVFGGANMGVKTNLVEYFDTESESFIVMPPLDFEVESMVTIPIGDRVLIYGGTHFVDLFYYQLTKQ